MAASRPLRVWFATWNMENQHPSADSLASLFVWPELAALALCDRPDLLVLGAQEMVRRGEASPFAAAHAQSWMPAGPDGRAYQWLGEAALPGFCAGVHNEQCLTILASASAVESGELCLLELRPLDLQHPVGRGAIAAAIQVQNGDANRALSFVTAHLDSESLEGREGDVARILSMLHPSRRAPADLCVLGGDLNYRSVPDGPCTVRRLCERILTDREGLFARDQLALMPSGLVAAGFVFPPPRLDSRPDAPLCYPSYKRQWHADPAAVARFRERRDVETCRAVYFPAHALDDEVPVKAHRATWSVGWLDRVGWRAEDPRLAPQNPWLHDFEATAISDHTPVCFRFDWNYSK